MYFDDLKMDSSEIIDIFRGLGCKADTFSFQGDSKGNVSIVLSHDNETDFEYPLYESATWLAEATEAFKKQHLECLEFNVELAKTELDTYKRIIKNKRKQAMTEQEQNKPRNYRHCEAPCCGNCRWFTRAYEDTFCEHPKNFFRAKCDEVVKLPMPDMVCDWWEEKEG